MIRVFGVGSFGVMSILLTVFFGSFAWLFVIEISAKVSIRSGVCFGFCHVLFIEITEL